MQLFFSLTPFRIILFRFNVCVCIRAIWWSSNILSYMATGVICIWAVCQRMFLIRFFFVGNNEKLNTKPFNIPFSFPPNFPEIGFYTEKTTFFVTNGACDQIEQIKRRSGKKSFIFVASHVGLKCLKCTRYNDVILNKSKFFQIDYITTITMC